MQNFRDNEKKQLKMTVSRPFWILFLQIYNGLSLCESLHIVLYAAILLFCFDFKLRKYHKITQI